MAISTEEVRVAVCNYCHKREYSEDGTFRGVSGAATLVRDGIIRTVEFYSCSPAPSHLGRAAASAIEAWQPLPTNGAAPTEEA